MCKKCLKQITDWDRENLSPKDMFDLFGPPMPRRLCYYHRKIHDGLIDKPEEVGGKSGMQVWNYRPLVHALSWKWAAQLNLEYHDLVQQGYSILAALAHKVDWGMDPSQISNYIKRSVEGDMKDHIAHSSKTVRVPAFQDKYFDVIVLTVGYEDNTRWYTEEPDPEEQCLLNNQLDLAKEVLAVVLETLNEREAYVLWNHIIAEEPQPMREIANQFHCSKDSIFRDSKRLLKLLQDEGKREIHLQKEGEREMLDTNV